MALLNVVGRSRLRKGQVIREIARWAGLSRKTIKKYLESDVVEPPYAARPSQGKLLAFEKELTV